MTEIRLLGPVEVWADGVEVDVGSAKPRLVLAALAVEPGRVVPTDVITDRVWGNHPPGRPEATLYSYLSLLRRALRPTGIGITYHRGGYVLDVAEATVDAVRFAEMVSRAKPDLTSAMDLREALRELWRGVPLAGQDTLWATQYRAGLLTDRLSAWLLLSEQLECSGELGEVADDLARLVGDYPLSEPLSGYLMRALAHAGRRAEALAHYAELRERLISELGEEPSDEVRSLHLGILRRDPQAAGCRQRWTDQGRGVPRQLPSIPPQFAGRGAELKALDTLLAAPRGAPAAVISGTAGIGKTALALHWAHQVAGRFPDGQLFVDLHGFDPTGKPTTPANAIRACLDALGTHPDRVPPGLEAQTALFRSLTADRRLLVVLDNARDTDQVRPLIPAAQGCVVLVTSRNQLTGLVAELGAHSITLDLLSPADAETLLSQRIGPERVAGEPTAAAALAGQCNYLPLALSVLAAEAAQTPELPLAALAGQLADGTERLDRLDTADPMTSVRTVLSWSYDAQDPAARRLFRMLGLHPGPDISVRAAASLAGTDPAGTAQVLRRLCRATLLSRPAADRYSHHDLLRAYAGEVVVAEEPETDRGAALRRAVDHYLHTAYHAVSQLNPDRDDLDLGAPDPGVRPEEFTDVYAALDWFAAELAVLSRLVDVAAGAGLPQSCWQLADLVARYLGRQGRWRDAIAIEQVGLTSAQALDDPGALGLIQRGLAYFCARTGQHAEARDRIDRALVLTRASGDRRRVAYALGVAGFIAAQRNEFRAALAYAKNSVRLLEALDSRSGQLRALASISWYLAQLGDVDDAIANARHALGIAHEFGDVKPQAAVHDTLGYLNRRRGQYDDAIRSYQKAVDLFRTIDDRFYVATALRSLGDVHAEAGDLPEARTAWTGALRIFEELDHPLADQARDRLGASGGD